MTRRSRDELCRIAEETFGWTQLRPEQLEAMEPVTDGHDVLAVLPTGAGKSAIYQVPALLLDGPTVVVSPLIALQRDQREGLAGTDAPDAVVILERSSRGDPLSWVDGITADRSRRYGETTLWYGRRS